jgi:hypothetical protein
MLPPHVQAVTDDVLPIIRAFADGRYAVSVAGSVGRGNADQSSDIDIRMYVEALAEDYTRVEQRFDAAMARWKAQGVVIDGCWIRPVDEVSAELDQWVNGVAMPEPIVWTIWGYHLPCDVYHQTIVEDPFGILAAWKAQVQHYPPLMKAALLAQHLAPVRYWKQDYHYRHKVQRQDVVFLAGLTSKLVHHLIQILFALNETYYVGDGNNLAFVGRFAHVPDNFAVRVAAVLYPQPGEAMYEQQRDTLFGLIDDVEALVARLGAA